jgi:hypothetical protein
MPDVLAIPPHTVQLPKFAKTKDVCQLGSFSASTVAHNWITRFESVLREQSYDNLASVLHPDCWWRDMLTLQWDLRAVHGIDRVTEYLRANLPQTQLQKFRLRDAGTFQPVLAKPLDDVEWIEAMFDFETKIDRGSETTFGRGSGVFRLVLGSSGTWTAYTLSTVLEELKGYEERIGDVRPIGTEHEGPKKPNWLERRAAQHDFVGSDPAVLVVGAGAF